MAGLTNRATELAARRADRRTRVGRIDRWTHLAGAIVLGACILHGDFGWAPAQALEPLVIRAEPGQNVTLHTAWNFDGIVWIRIVDAQTGEPATATLWSIGIFKNYDHGIHTGSAAIEVWGLRDQLRAGHVSVPTIFLVTADGGVWGKISSGGVEAACRYLGTECPLPELP
ncbi:MAG: hypothetical protein E5Y58_05335 [Mesorhizobium sp.]|nr:MAG: hypothetical protein E5Y58_05335 [Mesorhizobium sp.]